MVRSEKADMQEFRFKSVVKRNLRWAVTTVKWASNKMHKIQTTAEGYGVARYRPS